MDHNWVHSTPYSGVPPMAVIGGHDCDGSQIYVGRSFFEGDRLPAKVIPSKNAAYVAWGGRENVVHTFEILCGNGYRWVPCSSGHVPPNAVQTGMTSTHEPLYVGRGHWQGSLTVGKIHPTHHCLYIPFGGQEHRVNQYEVLVHERGDQWIPSQAQNTHNWTHSSPDAPLPSNAIVGGHDSDGSTIYVGRSFHEGDLLPAKVIPSKRCAYVSKTGIEFSKLHYELLCGQNLTWKRCDNGTILPGAISGGKTSNGEELFIGRGRWGASLTVGKVHPSQRCLYIAYDGAERRIEHFEILVNEVQCVPRPIPAEVHDGSSFPSVLPSPAVTPAITHDGSYGGPSPTPAVSHYQSPINPTPTPGLIRDCSTSIPPPTPVFPAPIPGDYQDGTKIGFILKPYPAGANDSASSVPPPMMPFPVLINPSTPIRVPNYPPPYTTTMEPSAPRPHSPPPAYDSNSFAPVFPPSLPSPAHQAQSLPIKQETAEIWIHCYGNTIPPNAVFAGTDMDLSTLYVGRAFHEGDLLPAKVNPSKGSAFVTYGGQEILKDSYEILTGTGFEWIPSHDGYVPPDAIIGGRNVDGETLYIGRGQHLSSITPGKIQPSQNCLYIPFSGGEVKLTNYEVLVRRNGKLLTV